MLEVPQLPSGNPQLQTAMNKLVKAESKGLDKTKARIDEVTNRKKLVTDLKTKFRDISDALTPFKSVRDFRSLIGDSNYPDVLTAKVDPKVANPGTYELEVLEMANTHSIYSTGFPDKDQTQVGVGFLSFDLPNGESRDVYINSDNNTLEGVAKSINEAKIGVRALVVHDGTDAEEPWRLILSGEKTGWPNIQDWAHFNLLDGDIDWDIDNTREAKSAVVKVNGQPVMFDENNIKTLLPGVNIDLKKAAPGTIVKLDIRPDYQLIAERAKKFVEKMNQVLSFINNQFNLTEKRDPTKALGGDVGVQSMQSRMVNLIQRTMNEMDEAQVQRLLDVGIVLNKGGTLDIDEKRFQQKLENNFEEVEALFSGTGAANGFAHKMLSFVDGITRSGDGVLTVGERSLDDRIRRMEDQMDRAETRAQSRIDRAKMQFAKAEAAIEKMQQFRANPVLGSMG